jgi:BirA family biotin operon repressor/biotin-[acetyl-CoA-carboxylase] ligase
VDLEILAGLAGRIEWHDTIGSTNDRARELAAGGVRHGFVVGADAQTAGRGRKGADWRTEPGRGLAFSVIVRPAWRKDRWGWLSLAAGLAVCEALEELELRPAIKWPNDVLLDGGKVCGILIETVGEQAVVGIGINVNERSFPEGLGAVSLWEVRGQETSRETVLGAVWAGLMTALRREPTAIAEDVWKRLAWREGEIETRDGVRGRIRGFGENGELTIETAGRLIRILDADGVRLRGGAL